jgi:hypothetical protein
MGVNPSVKAQTGTNVETEVIIQNTTWNKAGSPYTLMGPISVAAGVTLTIDAGVTINLGIFNLNVNGTLNAQGTSTDKIVFNSLSTNVSPPQNINIPSANAQCTIENAILNTTSILSLPGASIRIENCVFENGAGISVGGSSTIISGNYITGEVEVQGSAVVSDNTILGGVAISYLQQSTVNYSYTISDNNITNPNGSVMVLSGTGTISGNIISGGSIGILIGTYTGTIEGNLIINNQFGIEGGIYAVATIQNNTIANNGIGFYGPFPGETIIYNNIEKNSNYNMETGKIYSATTSTVVNATYNWWGPADFQAISQTIFDNSAHSFWYRNVNFVPFLNSPNPQAPAVTIPIPALTPSPTTAITPTVPEFSPLVIVPLLLSMLSVAVLVRHRKNR